MQEGPGGSSADGVVAVSKGVIQRDHQHAATITGENLFQPPNPFNLMSEDDVDDYKAGVEKQPQSDSGMLCELLTSVHSLCGQGHARLMQLGLFIVKI